MSPSCDKISSRNDVSANYMRCFGLRDSLPLADCIIKRGMRNEVGRNKNVWIMEVMAGLRQVRGNIRTAKDQVKVNGKQQVIWISSSPSVYCISKILTQELATLCLRYRLTTQAAKTA